MRNTKTSVWLLAAVATGFTMGFVGCGPGDTPTPTTCSNDSACGTGEMCHPLLRSCIKSCTGSGDCGPEAKTCRTYTGLDATNDAGVKAFCQCSTDALCGMATAGQVCNETSTKVCAAKCTSNTNCPTGATCDTATGRCNLTAATDAGMDGGVDAGAPCTPGSCTGATICDPATRACAAAASCNSAMPQPDTCVYGLACSGSACAEAPRTTAATCANFTNVMTPLLWDPATVATKGAVTTAFAPRATNDNSFCSGTDPNAFTFTVDLYSAPNTNFPVAIAMAQADSFNYVRTDGQIVDLRASVRPASGYADNLTNGNKNVRIVWTGCAASTVMSVRAGFYAKDGNANCATANR